MKLVFEEYFKGDSLDLTKWRIIEGGHGWGNNEDQFYVNSSKNLVVSDGLKIIGLKEKYQHRNYTSAKIETLQNFKYGHFEVVAKVPVGDGAWPAVWMMPKDKSMGWPKCGEIDIVECIGRNPNTMHFSLHTGLYNHMIGNQRTKVVKIANTASEFKLYTMDWNENFISFGIDGKEYARFEKADPKYEKGVLSWPFDKEFYIICNLAIGGYWGGKIDDDALPMTFEIKSIKVYSLE